MEPSLKRLIVATTIIASITSIIFINESRSDNNMIRIALLKDITDTIVETRGRFQIQDLLTQQILWEGRVLRKSRVRIHDTGIQIGRTIYPARSVRIISNKTIQVLTGERYRKYRGFVDIIAQNDKKILVVNALDLEEYVRGVLYHEVTDRFPMQAMMAQAVAVRSYALYQLKRSKRLDYDVTSDIYSQVYGGRSAERYRTNLAARRTEGQIMLYKNEVLPAYYHSNSGGFTEDVSELWNHDLAPLKGRQDPYSLKAPNSNWKKNFRSRDVQDLLNKNGFNIGPIRSVEIIERTSSGRVKILEIKDRDGQSVKIEGKKLRDIIGPNELKSNFYDVEMKGYYFDVLGKGWGHGVGMSQWGANAMAKERVEYKDIIQFYYPGVKISKL